MPRGDGLVHATLGGYTNYRCRCQPCRDAYAAYSREWRARNPERAKAIQQRNAQSPARIASRRAWREKNRDRVRANERLRTYGLSAEEFVRLMKQQGGVCAICFRPQNGGRALDVDHDHETGQVRGLLCGACNAAIGLLGDTPDRLRRAAVYLDQAAER
jgi:hypothetical protein